MIMQIKINFPQILIWSLQTMQRVSVPNLKLFGPMKTEIWPKKFESFLLRKMGKLAGTGRLSNM